VPQPRSASDIHVLVAGKDAKAAADAAAKLDGVAKVLHAEGDEYANRLAEPLAALIVSLADGYDTLMAPATTVGQERHAARRSPARRDADLRHHRGESADTFKRPIYAGNALQTVKSTDAKRVITVRTASFSAAGEGGSASVETVSSAGDPGLSSFVKDAIAESDRPELTSAKIIISGGRALGSSEKFQEVILPVADKLGAAVGASAPPSMPATRRTTGRSDRPARWSLPISTSPAASPVRSSTLPA
jgi:electron transfer flavoprotein alpha subunit